MVLAIQQWIRNTAAELRRQVETGGDPAARQDLEELAEVNERLVEEAPQTTREACQWIIWFHLASRTYNRDGAGGQLDALLWPYYQRDLAEGRIDEDTAVYYLACLLLNDPVYWQLGGPDADGRDLTCRLSWLVLEAARLVDSSLNLTVRVHEGLCPDFLREAVGCLLEHRNGWPRFSGDRALVEGFCKNGYPPELARQRIAVGCNWMSLPGLEYTMNDLVKVNVAKVFEVALEGLISGPKAPSCQGLWEGFCHHLQQAVRVAADGIRFHLRHQKDNEPELLLNLLSHGPLERGLDVSDGGATYYHLAIDGAGLGTVADSFAALEQRVEREGRLTWPGLHRLLQEDWPGLEGERLRRLMRRSQRYCQGGGSLGDVWAERISRTFTEQVRAESDVGAGRLFIPGWFSWAHTLLLGEQVGATPDGRRAREPISHGANPNPGFREDGACTAMARAIAQIQPGYGNTAPMQLELDPGVARPEQVEAIGALIRAHFALGGTLLNVNILDKERILEAHRDPSRHPELVVRVTGFTAYFAILTPPFRQLVIDRILEA